MPVNLTKGQKVSITKDNPGLTNVVVGLGWDTNQYDTGADSSGLAALFKENIRFQQRGIDSKGPLTCTLIAGKDNALTQGG